MSEMLNSGRPSLRATKRERTASEMVSNAVRLFRKKGVRAASLAEIARASGVSQATLFNYFPNKGALAEAWVRGEIDAAIARATRELGDHGLRSAMRGLSRELGVSATGDREIRLEAWHATGRAARDVLSQTHPLVRAIASEQERERVRADLGATTLGEMIRDAIEGGLIEALRAALDEVEAAKRIRARVDLVLDAARKRNERVAAPTASSRIRS